MSKIKLVDDKSNKTYYVEIKKNIYIITQIGNVTSKIKMDKKSALEWLIMMNFDNLGLSLAFKLLGLHTYSEYCTIAKTYVIEAYENIEYSEPLYILHRIKGENNVYELSHINKRGICDFLSNKGINLLKFLIRGLDAKV